MVLKVRTSMILVKIEIDNLAKSVGRVFFEEDPHKNIELVCLEEEDDHAQDTEDDAKA